RLGGRTRALKVRAERNQAELFRRHALADECPVRERRQDDDPVRQSILALFPRDAPATRAVLTETGPFLLLLEKSRLNPDVRRATHHQAARSCAAEAREALLGDTARAMGAMPQPGLQL